MIFNKYTNLFELLKYFLKKRGAAKKKTTPLNYKQRQVIKTL